MDTEQPASCENSGSTGTGAIDESSPGAEVAMSGSPAEDEAEAVPRPTPETADSPSEDTPETGGGEPPASRSLRREHRVVGIAVALGLVILLTGGALIWRTRSEVAAARKEIASLKETARKSELKQARAALLRAQAELGPAREALSPELAEQVERAEVLLADVAERLRTTR